MLKKIFMLIPPHTHSYIYTLIHTRIKKWKTKIKFVNITIYTFKLSESFLFYHYEEEKRERIADEKMHLSVYVRKYSLVHSLFFTWKQKDFVLFFFFFFFFYFQVLIPRIHSKNKDYIL